MAKYCTNCGKNMDSDATFCVYCGTHNTGEVKSSFTSRGSFSTEPVNGFAVGGLMLSFMLPVTGLILSLIGLKKAKESDDNGKGIAIAGIITAATILSFRLLFLIISFTTNK